MSEAQTVPIRTMTRLRFALLTLLALSGAVWLVGGLYSSLNWHPPAYVNRDGVAIGRDFVALRAAALLALEHRPEAAYDATELHAVEEQVVGAPIETTTWFYPPFVQLLTLPLALPPYLVALALWVTLPLAGFLALTRQIGRHWLALPVSLLFPAVSQNLIIGQNGAITALLIGGGLLALDRRPVLAGLCFGLLGYKPQMAAAVYAALVFGGYWRCLAVAAATLVLLGGASLLAFGTAPWLGFLQASSDARTMLETGVLPWEKLMSVFAAARLLGLSIAVAYVLQGAVALAALAALWSAWREPKAPGRRAAVLVLVIPLVTPYLFGYDLVVTLLAFAWLVEAGCAQGFRRGEIPLLAIAWIAPVAGWLAAWAWGVQPTPLLLGLTLLAVLTRRPSPPQAA